MPDNKNLLNFDDLADVFAQLNDIEDAPEELTEEEKASQRRYEEIIKKHKNDVFRLTELIDPTAKVVAPQGVYADIQEFVQRMKNENVDIKQLGLVGRTKEKILEELKAMYETL